ncbi:MAG: PAS domain-containing protein, partial [Cyanobacteriota bacterium]
MRIDQRFLPYGVSIGLTAIALLLTLSLEPFLTQSVSAFFFVAITVSTWYGGLKPGFVTIVLSTLAINQFFVHPLGQFTDITTSDLIRLATFCLVAIVIHLLSHNLRNSKRRVEQLSQQLLEESADRLRTALNAAQMGMWDWNLVTGEINWSPEHEQLFGLTPGAFDGIYKTFESYLHPDDRETVNQAVQQALQTHSSYQNEFRVVWADGSIHWIEGRGHAFYDETGQPVRMTGTAMAIDARKQAEAALRQSEQRYRSLVHASAQIVWTADADGRATAAPIGWDWEEMTGQPEAEHLRRGWLDVVHPDDRDRSLQHWLESCTHSTLYETEYRLRMKDGSYRDFAVRGVPILDADGNISEWIGTCTDITERKQAELALRKSEQQLKLALEAAHAGAWTWELTTNKQYWSEELYRVFGLEPGSVNPSYENADKRLHPEDREWVGTEVAKAIEQGKNTNLEHRILLPDGTVRWVNGISQMFLDESGQPETLAGLVVDITERKLAEIALRESEAKFRLLAETIEEVFLIQSADYSQTFYISPAYERIWERSCESLYENPAAWIESVYPEDRDNLFAQMQQVMSGEICRTEYRMIKPSGELRWIGVQAFPVFDEAGQIYRLIASAQDITDRKQAQAALQESQIQLQRQLAEIETIYQSAPIGLNVVDTELRFVRINQRLAQMNGFPVEAHIGRTVRELLPDLADAAEQLLGSILETGEPLLNVEISGETPAQPGVQRTWLESFLPLKDGDQIIGISTVCEEITERKRIEAERQQAEEELKRAKEELEFRVAERTAKLTEVNDRLLVTLLHQQQIEASLRQSEEKFRQLAEN